jgi:hypothetical protein
MSVADKPYVLQQPDPLFYPLHERCGHAHPADAVCYDSGECCAYCPGCERQTAPTVRNAMISVVHHTTPVGDGWQHQWCRALTRAGKPCRNREYIYVLEDTEVEQFLCDSHDPRVIASRRRAS